MPAWKDLEREIAELVKGKRNHRGGDFGQSMSDVEHPLFCVECKYRRTLPKLLLDGIAQAISYDRDKIPILALKQRQMRGALIVMKSKDFERLFRAVFGDDPVV